MLAAFTRLISVLSGSGIVKEVKVNERNWLRDTRAFYHVSKSQSPRSRLVLRPWWNV